MGDPVCRLGKHRAAVSSPLPSPQPLQLSQCALGGGHSRWLQEHSSVFVWEAEAGHKQEMCCGMGSWEKVGTEWDGVCRK